MPEPETHTEVTITVRDNGNLRVVGPISLLDGEGNVIEVEAGRAVTLCRCGASATKPFCDSTHRAIGFASVVRTTSRGEDSAAG